MPLTREQVLAAAARRFPTEETVAILAILDQYGIEEHEWERERVHLAILRLSEGDINRLRYFTQLAKGDRRDILLYAEYLARDGSQVMPRNDTAALLDWVMTSPPTRSER